MKKILLFLTLFTFSNVVLANNDMAKIKTISHAFKAKWHHNLKTNVNNNTKSVNYQLCKQFAVKPALTLEHAEELFYLIEGNGEKARVYAEPLFELYLLEYNSIDFEDALYAVFDYPNQILDLCKDDNFAYGITKATSVILGY